MKLRRRNETREQLAIKEHARLTRELVQLHEKPFPDPQLTASLRMCRAHIERQLRARGFEVVRGIWRHVAAA